MTAMDAATSVFECFLLARMHGERATRELAAREYNIDLLTPKQREALRLIELPAHPASAYIELLGAPVRTGKAPINESSPFTRSSSYWFLLPAWPLFAFVVHEHPAGWAWVEGFVRRLDTSAPPSITDPSQLEPWSITLDEIPDNTEKADAWDMWIEVVWDDTILTFDYSLLQAVRPGF